MELYRHQQNILDKNPHKALLCWDTGTGKSIGSISLANLNNAKPLVIVPKALKPKWKRDLEKMCDNDWLLLTKEEFKREYKDIEGYDALIVDEAHYFSGMKSQISLSLQSYRKRVKPEFVWLLTATPYLSTPWNIYVLGKHLGQPWNYNWFDEKFFIRRYIYGRYIPTPKPGIQHQIAELVHQMGDVVRIEDCADVPEQVFEELYFDERKEQTKAKEKITEIESNPVVKYTKFHQIENGVLKGNEFEANQYFPSDKTDYIMEMVNNHKKIAIFCRYNQQVHLLKSNFEKLQSKPVFVITGQTKDRDAVVQEIEESTEAVVLINASCSEGYELPSVGVILFASLSFSYKDYRQALGRFLRINKLKKNVYIHLITKGGVDEAVYKSILMKQDFSIEIYARDQGGAMLGE